MQIVILAAGRGTRMKDLTDNVPKPMLEIKGKPLLAYKLEALPEEIDEVIFVIGYLGNQIQKYFGNSYAGKKISYAVQEELNGGGGALLVAKDLLKDEFIVMMGDDLYRKEDIERVMKYEFGLLGLEVDDPTRFGIISLNNEGNLAEVVEKPNIPGPALANIALYKLNKKFFDYPLVYVNEREGYTVPQTLATVAKDFPVHVEKATEWFPISNPEHLKEAEKVIDKFI